jgi:hypothetical protein
MLELLWVGLLVVGLGVVTATALVPAEDLLSAGQALMLGAGALGIPLELAYFGTLAVALGRDAPTGWYWRSFAHHHLLSPLQRRWVLPWFYAGALAFLGIALGIGLVVMAFVAALRQA